MALWAVMWIFILNFIGGGVQCIWKVCGWYAVSQREGKTVHANAEGRSQQNTRGQYRVYWAISASQLYKPELHIIEVFVLCLLVICFIFFLITLKSMWCMYFWKKVSYDWKIYFLYKSIIIPKLKDMFIETWNAHAFCYY